MTRARRFLLAATLGFLPGLLLAAARPADASGVRYLESYKDSAGLNGAYGLALSPDGRHLYVAAENANAVLLFERDPTTGHMTFVTSYANGGAIEGLRGAHAVAVSPDGAHVYIASKVDDALVVFVRDAATGTLTYAQTKYDGRGPVNGLDGGESVVISPDGKHIYVAGRNDNAVAVFSRDAATGFITWIQMKRDGFDGIDGIAGAKGVGLSPDGAHLYVAGSLDNALAVFGRDAATGMLTFIEVMHDDENGVDGLEKARFVMVTPDGANVLVAGGLDDKLAVFSRDAATGALHFLEMHQDELNGVNGLNGANGIAVSPDGSHVYVTGNVDDALAVFTRNPATGALTYLERKRDNLSGVDGLDSASAVVVSPDGQFVYATGYVDDAVAAFHKSACGDGFLDAGEVCDDANNIDGDCCSATCQAEAKGNPCADDGNLCTDDKCNAQGACTHPTNTAPCDDGAYCTVGDVCRAGTCQGTARDCSAVASDQCHQGTCDEATDTCIDTAKPEGGSCNDANPCTQGDACHAGVCTAGSPLTCTPQDSCHEAGVCNPSTGLCSNPVKADGSPCTDGNACTQTDTCTAGTCGGTNPIVCTAQDQCHNAGTCIPATGLCSNPNKPNGTACNDGSACTQTDACSAGTCTGTNPIVCTAQDQCHQASCTPATGTCQESVKDNGSVCDDGNASTENDVCTAGTCAGTPLGDRDGDGIADPSDICPDIPNPTQTDDNHNGVGDACECTAAAPGRCLAGGGPAKTDCLLEFNSTGPVTLNGKRTKLKGVLRCTDGDPSCDRDGAADGQCSFGVAVCLANADPRLAACQPVGVASFEMMTPKADRGRSELDRANALRFEQAASAMGVEIRRKGHPVTAGSGGGHDGCSALTTLIVPASGSSGKPGRRIFETRATATNGKSDVDTFTLECR